MNAARPGEPHAHEEPNRSGPAVAASESRRVVLALGSNLGDRLAYLQGAIDGLCADSDFTVVAVSNVYETAPVGGPEQGAYLNAVVLTESALDPYGVLERAHALEQAAARERIVRWGPRTLDVDVLWIDGVTLDDPVLTIPHPRLFERAFVLVPLADVAPDLATAALGAVEGRDDVVLRHDASLHTGDGTATH